VVCATVSQNGRLWLRAELGVLTLGKAVPKVMAAASGSARGSPIGTDHRLQPGAAARYLRFDERGLA
jgi:hypothetical protein